MEKKILIKIEIYTYYSKRARIYSPHLLGFFYRNTTLTRDEYTEYLRTLQVVAKTVEEMHFQGRVTFKVRLWYLWFFRPFLKKAFRSPVVIIGGELVSTGSAPDKIKIKEVLTKTERKYRFLEKK